MHCSFLADSPTSAPFVPSRSCKTQASSRRSSRHLPSWIVGIDISRNYNLEGSVCRDIAKLQSVAHSAMSELGCSHSLALTELLELKPSNVATSARSSTCCSCRMTCGQRHVTEFPVACVLRGPFSDWLNRKPKRGPAVWTSPCRKIWDGTGFRIFGN